MAYKMAIIGFGGMAGWHYKCISEKIDEIQVKGAYDIRPEVCEQIEKKGIKQYKSPQEIYDDPDIDLVLIATPNDVHKPYAIACLEAGKNVISEKPVTLNVKELEEIYEVAEKTGKFFTIHQNRRWDKDFLTIKKILDEKILTNPYRIESRVQGSRRALHGWRGHKINGGGMVLDWGVHLIDQMLMLIKSPVISIDAHLFSIYTPEVDDSFVALFRFENGITYLIEIATNCFVTQPRWHMCCADGTAVVQNWELEGKVVKLKNEEVLEWSEEIIYTAAGPTRSMAPRPTETITELELPETIGEWSEYYKNIAAKLAGKEELIVTREQALRVMRVIDTIFESHAAGSGIKCHI